VGLQVSLETPIQRSCNGPLAATSDFAQLRLLQLAFSPKTDLPLTTPNQTFAHGAAIVRSRQAASVLFGLKPD